MEMQGKKAENLGMTYHFAMSIFYRIDRNPHGPSLGPIMTVALEQADMGMLAQMLDRELANSFKPRVAAKWGPLMICLHQRVTLEPRNI